MVHCCAPGCHNGKKIAWVKGAVEVSFHGFPKNEVLRRKWVNAMGLREWNPALKDKICSLHFREEDYKRNIKPTFSTKCNLKFNAVPSIFDFPANLEELEVKGNILTVDSESDHGPLNIAEFSAFDVKVVHDNVQQCIAGQREPKEECCEHLHIEVVEVKNEKDEMDIPSQTHEEISSKAKVPVLNVINCKEDIAFVPKTEQQVNPPLFAINGSSPRQLDAKTGLNLDRPTEPTPVEKYQERIILPPPQLKQNKPKVTKKHKKCDERLIVLRAKKCIERKEREIHEHDIKIARLCKKVSALQDLFKKVRDCKCNTLSDDSDNNGFDAESSSVFTLPVDAKTTRDPVVLSEKNNYASLLGLDSAIGLKFQKDEHNQTEEEKKSSITIEGLRNAFGIGHEMESKNKLNVKPCVSNNKKTRKVLTSRQREDDIKDASEINPLHFRYKCKRVPGGFQCNLCKKLCKGKLAFFFHVRRDCPFQHFACTMCNNNYPNGKKLSQHLLSHGTTKNHMCENCGMAFPTQSGLNSHLRLHSEEKPFKCTECDFAFKRKDYLRYHEKTHHNKLPKKDETKLKYMCEICSKRLSNEHFLKMHIETHNSDAKYVCKKCGKAHTTEMGLKRHLTRNICENVLKQKGSDEKKKEIIRNYARDWHRRHKNDPGKFKCEFCSKLFRQPSLLKAHYDTHSTGKNYQCNLCSKRFKMKSSLNRHVASHGELKLACGHCNRRCVNPSELRVHMQSHSQERQFVCQCGKSFKFKSDLSSHMKKCGE